MELFDITFNNYTYKYNNSTETVIDSNGYKYLPSSIIRKDLTTDIEKAECNIIASMETKPFNTMIYQLSVIPVPITIKIYPEETVLFEGVIAGLNYDVEKGSVNIYVSSKISLNDITIPKVTYSEYCSWELFSTECGKNKEDFKVTLNTSNSTYNNITITNTELNNFASGYFINGYLQLDTGETMLITNNNGKTLTLLASLNTFSNAHTFNVYPGCDKTLNTCKNKYNNLENFSGFPYVPNNNPVTGEF